MAHNATHRRTLTAAEEGPNTKTKNSISMEPNFKKQPKPNPLAYPQDPYVPTNTIRNISNQFSQLYANHKNLTKSSSLKKESFGGGVSYSCVDTSVKAKSLAAHASSVFDSSCSALTKSKSQHSSRYAHSHRDPEVDKAIVVQKTADEIKKTSFSHKEKEPQKVIDMKRGFPMSFIRSQEIEKLKGFEEEVGCDDDELKRVSINGGIRRKSFCSSQVELADFFSCSGVKVVSVDMPPFMQIHAVNCARKTRDSLEKFTSKALASTLKKDFDGVYGPAWHCIVGTSFGSFVTHSVGGFIYFSMDHKLYVLLFKTSVQKAESS